PEHVAERALDLRASVIPHTQRTHRLLDEVAEGRDVRGRCEPQREHEVPQCPPPAERSAQRFAVLHYISRASSRTGLAPKHLCQNAVNRLAVAIERHLPTLPVEEDRVRADAA